LQVPGGVKTISKDHPEAKVYDISQFQIVQAEQLRAYPDRAGRRNLAQPIQNFEQFNPVDGGVKSSVKIAKDGSTAAFVPAERALSWQTTDKQGNAVVKERNWVTFQSGEIRTCAACHGINSKNQANLDAPAHKPEALRELLKYWKNTAK
jgi:cytochrome c553